MFLAGDVRTLAADERDDLALFLEGLDPDEWHEPCLPGWTVRDVATHVISYEHLGWRRLPAKLGRGRFSLGNTNQIMLAECASLSTEQVIQRYRDYPTPRGLTSSFGGRLGLTDALIHHQDIRRAIGRPRDVPADRLRVVIPFALFAPPLPARKLTRGLRLVATDLVESWGSGPEVQGPAEALLMAVVGRPGLESLSGPGVATLCERLEPTRASSPRSWLRFRSRTS